VLIFAVWSEMRFVFGGEGTRERGKKPLLAAVPRSPTLQTTDGDGARCARSIPPSITTTTTMTKLSL
jgi:hypothetical protein